MRRLPLPFEGWWLFAPLAPAGPADAAHLAFESAFRNRYPGTTPDIVAAASYDAAALAALVAAEAGERAPEASLRSATRAGHRRAGADDLRGLVGPDAISYEGASGLVVDASGSSLGDVGASEIDAVGHAREQMRMSGRDIGGPPYAP